MAMLSMAQLAMLSLAIAGDFEKDTCGPSLLQIGSSVHEARHSRRDDAFTDREAAGEPVRGHLLLQVAAKTGEVGPYIAGQLDEEPPLTARSVMSQGSSIGAGTSLLARGSASHNAEAGDPHHHHDDEHDDAATDKEADDSHHGHHHNEEETGDQSSTGNSDRDEEGPSNLQGARIAPFGKEDTSRELQHHAARTQDTLVDAIENAEVAEIKRSIFRSLTRLRAAEIKEFDTIARLETQAIDEYNDNHHYRSENPLDYIHGGEVGVKEDKYTSFHD
jgi:hypothetical protein